MPNLEVKNNKDLKRCGTKFVGVFARWGVSGLASRLFREYRLGVFTLVTRGWAASEFLTPNGEHPMIGPD